MREVDTFWEKQTIFPEICLLSLRIQHYESLALNGNCLLGYSKIYIILPSQFVFSRQYIDGTVEVR